MKKIVSLTLAFSFLIMSWSGIMLYVAPKGKVAFWTNWELMGLTKTQYTNIHITAMFLFLLIVAWHIYYNWRPLVSYIKSSAAQVSIWKKELWIAVAINAAFVAGALMGIQPFQSAIDLNDRIKAYWEKTDGAPPYGHAEESSFESIVQQMGITSAQAVESLKQKGYKVDDTSQTLQHIAGINGVSARTIYEALRPKVTKAVQGKKSDSDSSDVPFLGRRTLEELAGMGKIDLNKSVAYLKEKGVDASPQTTMKEANALGLMPFELYEELKTL